MSLQDVKQVESYANAFLAHRSAPIFLAIFSDACFIMMDGSIQMVERTGMSIGQIVFIRMAVTAIATATLLAIKDPSLLHIPTRIAPDQKWLWIRGIFNSIGLAFAYLSFEYITLSESITVFNLRPFPVALLCFHFLGEIFTKVQLLASVASMGAVILVVQSDFLSMSPNVEALQSVPNPDHRALGFTCITICMFLSAGDFFLLRKIRESDPLVIQLTYAISGLVIGPMWMIIFAELPSLPGVYEWLRLIFVAITGFIAQMTLVLALQRETGGTIAVLSYAQVVMAVLVQWMLTAILPSVEAYIGMAVIIIAGTWAVVKGRPEKEAKSEIEEHKLEAAGYSRLQTEEGDV